MVANLDPCPCCGYPTLDARAPGTFAMCPICGWADDDAQAADPSLPVGANAVSLREARASYAAIGAIEPRWVSLVRPPTEAERAAKARTYA